METLNLAVKTREGRGKNEARRLRADGMVPAVLYGYKTDATALSVNYRDLRSALSGGGHSVFALDFPDDEKREPVFAVLREIQTHPTKHQILHVDLLAVNLDEEIESPVSVELIGEAAGAKEGGVVDQTAWEIMVRALPRDVPSSVQLDISGLEIGDSLTAGELELPENVTLADDPHMSVVSVLAPQPVEEEAPEEEELPEGVEPELVEGEAAGEEPSEGDSEGEEA